MEDKISLRKAISYIFSSDKKWQAIFSWVAILIGVVLVMVILEIPTVIPFIGIFFSCIFLPLMIILEVAGFIYAMGYVYQVIDEVRNGNLAIPSVFKADHKKRFKSGAPYMLINFVYYLPSFIVSGIIYVVAIVAFLGFAGATGSHGSNASSYTAAQSGASIVIILLAALVGLVIYILFILNKFLADSAVYQYIQNKKLADAFDFNKVFETFKKGMNEHLNKFLRHFVVAIFLTAVMLVCYSPLFGMLGLGMLTDTKHSSYGMLSILLCCAYFVGIFVYYIVLIPISFYILPNMTGQMYRIWDKRGLNKA